MKYIYTAIFEPEDKMYNVSFPDLEECYTCGDNLADALKMAEDALSSYLTWQEDHNRPVPQATAPEKVTVPEGCVSTMIEADTDHYRRKPESRESISPKSFRKPLKKNWLQSENTNAQLCNQAPASAGAFSNFLAKACRRVI